MDMIEIINECENEVKDLIKESDWELDGVNGTAYEYIYVTIRKPVN